MDGLQYLADHQMQSIIREALTWSHNELGQITSLECGVEMMPTQCCECVNSVILRMGSGLAGDFSHKTP